MDKKFIMTRNADGTANVMYGNVKMPQPAVWHSPTGFEFGFGGSGPADLALNILEITLRDMGYKGERQKLFKGSCFNLAAELHQAFKWLCIAPIDRNLGGELSFEFVKDWIEKAVADKELTHA